MTLALYQGDLLTGARRWADLEVGERRRRAVVAAQGYEAGELWSLTEAHTFLRRLGVDKGEVSEAEIIGHQDQRHLQPQARERLHLSPPQSPPYYGRKRTFDCFPR